MKSRDFALVGGIRRAGEPIHEMWWRITIDTWLNIIAAEARSDAVPYPGHCEDNCGLPKLAGISLRPGFMVKVREAFAVIRGCTYITELIGAVATAA